MKEQLVEMTGLSPRVIRVWFQNKRCKDKKKTIQMKLQMQQEKVRDYFFFLQIFPYWLVLLTIFKLFIFRKGRTKIGLWCNARYPYGS